jgi:hypothetical protein
MKRILAAILMFGLVYGAWADDPPQNAPDFRGRTLKMRRKNKTASYTFTRGDGVVIYDGVGPTATFTMPTAAHPGKNDGGYMQLYWIVNSSTAVVTCALSGSDTFADTSTTHTLHSGESVCLGRTSNQWHRVSYNPGDVGDPLYVGDLYVTNNFDVGGEAFFAEYIKHTGDTNTYFRFTNDAVIVQNAGMDVCSMAASTDGSGWFDIPVPLTTTNVTQATGATFDAWILLVGSGNTNVADKLYELDLSKAGTGTVATAGTNLLGGGVLGSAFRFDHTAGSLANIDGSGGTVVQDVQFDSTGHPTNQSSVDLDGRYYTETEINTQATGYAGTGTVVTAGTNLIGGGVLGSAIRLDHETGSLADIDNSNGIVMVDMQFDPTGHPTNQTSTDLDGRYYTETEADALLLGKADTNVAVTAGTNLLGGGVVGTAFRIDHTVGILADIDNANGTVMQDVQFDSAGHPTNETSVDLDGRYYTETEADALLLAKADTNITATAGTNLLGGGVVGTNFRFDHEAGSLANIDNANGVVVQDMQFDGTGHPTNQTSADLDDRYYTETEVDAFFPGNRMTTNFAITGDGVTNDFWFYQGWLTNRVLTP